MPLRWGIVGAGDIVRKRVARAILDHPDCRLVAVCRRDENKLRDFARKFGVERTYTDADALLRDPDVDAVYISTPVHLHLPQTLAAARAGKHVLVEKPMARSVAECDQMIDACRVSGVKLGVAYYRRFYPAVARMRELLTEGTLGVILSASAVTTTPFAIGPEEEGYWRVLLLEGGGGSLMDIGSHRIDLFLDLFGPVEEVVCRCATRTGPFQAEDCATLLLRFASGVQGTLQCFFGTSANRDEFTIIGSNGWVRADPLNGDHLIVDIKGERREELHPAPANLHAPLIAEFVEAVHHDRDPRIRGEEGRRTNEVMERAYRDAGRPMPW
jgi:predicted dehydrogenase